MGSAKEREHATFVRQMSHEDKIDEGLKLLEQRTSFIDVSIVRMEDDGNCQFRALAHELHGEQSHHLAVRAKVTAHLRAHSDEYSFFVGDDADWQQYLSDMAQNRTWGDKLTLRAASEVYGCMVHVVTTERDNWLLRYGEAASADAKPRQRHVFLAYVAPIHYNVIEPLAGRETQNARV